MTRKTRYLLILVGAIFFTLAAPLIIIYVRGLRFDVANKNFIHTGVLAVNAEPNGAQVFLDDVLARESSGNIRFLLPKEYLVSLRQQGYWNWEKRLPINADQVTWLNAGLEKIFLFKKHPSTITLAEKVQRFSMLGKNLVYLTASDLFIKQMPSSGPATKLSLPKDLVNKNLGLTLIKNGQFALLEASIADNSVLVKNKIFMVNLSKQKFTDVTSLLTQEAKVQIAENGLLYSLENNSLFSLNPENKTKTLLTGNVKAFALADNGLYYINSKAESFSLNLLNLNNTENQEVVKNLPELSDSQILVSRGKQIFIISKGSLFWVNNPLQQLANGLNQWQFESGEPGLIYSNFGELDYFDFDRQSTKLITRSTSSMSNLRLNQKVGYAFFITQKNISALELDTRDRQNEYNLYQGEKLQKFEIDSDAKTLVVLDNGILKTLSIR